MKGKHIAAGGLAIGTGLFIFILVIILFAVFMVMALGSAYIYFSLVFLDGKWLPLWFILAMFILAVLKLSSLIMRFDAGLTAIASRSYFRRSLDGASLVISVVHTAFLGYLFFIAKTPFSGLMIPALVVLGILLVAKITGFSLHLREAKKAYQEKGQGKKRMIEVEGRVVK
jgi:hypothetical protein